MLDDIEKWIAIMTALGAALWSYFRNTSRIHRLEERHDDDMIRRQAFENSMSDDVEKLKEDRTRINTKLEDLVSMQKENRLDVKLILQQIAALAAQQGQQEK